MNKVVLFSTPFLLQEVLYRKRSHSAARLQERNVAFTAMTGSFSENRAENADVQEKPHIPADRQLQQHKYINKSLC